MINLILCDDDDIIRQEIKNIINNEILIHEYDLKIEICTSSPVVVLEELKKIESTGNIYFLDVDLKHPEYDGFQLGKKVRELDPKSIIIYITSFNDLAYKTFQYHIEAFDYIVKSDISKLRDTISKCLQSIKEKLEQNKINPINYFTCKVGNIVKHIPLDDIYYFETSSKAHHIILHGKHQCIDFIGELSTIEKELEETFFKIHRSYLVALDKIEEIDLKHNKLTIDGHICDISRKVKSKLLERLHQ